MSLLTTLYALGFYLATAILVLGLIAKIAQYTKTPAPLKIPLTPAPLTKSGVAFRLAREVLFFESLFKSNKWIWIFSAMFHAGMALALLRHLRYFTEPVWDWVVLVQPFGIYAGMVMVVGLLGLWARRFLVDRVRYVTNLSDHLMLLILVMIGVSGLMMKFVAHTDIIAVKAFMLGLMYFDWQPLPTDTPLLVHLGLVILLMVVFPFSKLLHAPGIFFSPTRNQTDTPREHRHVAPWARPLDAQRDARMGQAEG